MRKIKSIVLVTILAIVLLFSFACNNNIENIDTTKSQLFISNYNGGYGSDWINAVKTRFEQEYATTSFQDGKVGVQLMIDNNKNTGIDIFSTASSSINEVFFAGNMFYYDWVGSNKFLNITDIIEAENIKDDNKTIESKMSDEQISYYKTNKNEYYAIPHYSSFCGINYDIDLFEFKKLYYAKNGVESENYALDMETYGGYGGTVIYTGEGEKSAGPDGLHGTDDDGLPATYDEFFALCSYMQTRKGVTPFVWSGKYASYYIDYFLASLMADYEGYDQTMLNYTFEGKATNLISVSSQGTITALEEIDINSSNGWQVYSQAGRYYALEFLENIIKGNYVLTSSFGSTSHIDAQTTFLKSSYNNEPIAFLIEGTWWENEAKNTFKYMEQNYGDEYSKTNRRIGFLPLPKTSNDKIANESTLVNTDTSLAFIKANIDNSKILLAKTFLQFCNTDLSLQEYTSIVGFPKSIKYELDNTQYNKLSHYEKQIWDYNKNAKIVHPLSKNPIFLSNQYSFVLYNTFDTAVFNNALSAIYNGDATAISFFNGIKAKYNESSWQQSYGN
jgi:hypothetical protein